jgi:hypothetical protein
MMGAQPDGRKVILGGRRSKHRFVRPLGRLHTEGGLDQSSDVLGAPRQPNEDPVRGAVPAKGLSNELAVSQRQNPPVPAHVTENGRGETERRTEHGSGPDDGVAIRRHCCEIRSEAHRDGAVGLMRVWTIKPMATYTHAQTHKHTHKHTHTHKPTHTHCNAGMLWAVICTACSG